jgi:hypothetical protein
MQVNRPRILAVLPGFIPSTMITVVKPLVNLHRAGRISARIVLESQAGRNDTDWADAIVLCRNTEPRHAPLLAAARSRGTPLIYDLDDNLFELPPNCEGLSRLREASRQAMLTEYLRAAALVRVYSQPLADRVATVNPRVVQTFAPVDMSLVPPPPPASGCPTRPPGPIKIVYATSRTQDPLCEIFWPALTRILGRYGDRIEAHFWGCRPPIKDEGGRRKDEFGLHPSSFILHPSFRNVRHHGLVCQYDRYLRRFSRAGYDIGLAPLPDDVFYRSKTNNKFREYGASGIAGIYSHNEVYSHCVQHEFSGLLVSNDAQSWHDAIERLIEDAALRTRIQQEARQYVREHYAQEKFEQLFLEQIRDVLSTPAELPALAVPRAASPWNATRGCLSPASPAAETGPSTQPGFFRRLGEQGMRSLGTLRQLGPRQGWTALRWFVNDRCLAAWLRWQLWRPTEV